MIRKTHAAGAKVSKKRIRWAASGDVNAFFGLMLDNIADLLLTVSLLAGVFGFPATFALQYMVPGTAIGVLFGDLMFFFLALALARRTGRDDVTAMPLGLDTPSTIAMVLFVLGPAFLHGKDLGLSEAGPETIRRANTTHPISVLQSEYSLWCRDLEADVLPACRECGIGFAAYSPVGRGFLTATIKDLGTDLLAKDRRHDHPRFHPENFEQNLKLLPVLEDVAADKGCTAGQLALAWLLAKGEDIVPIPGVKHADRLDENLAATEISLSGQEIAKLESVFTPGVTAGTRYPAGQMKRIGI